MYALYTFHWESGHSNHSEPVWQTFAQETLLEANYFPKWNLSKFCINFSCTPTFEPWFEFKKETK